jgi:hypothetical protein
MRNEKNGIVGRDGFGALPFNGNQGIWMNAQRVDLKISTYQM